jgi:hypothetical protein
MTSLGPVSFMARGALAAGSSALLAAAILASAGAIGFIVNWAMLLLVLPPGGYLSSGARYLFFGVLFPVAWCAAAQPLAVARGLGRFYRTHRDEVLSFVASALQSEAAGDADQTVDRWMDAIKGLRAHIDQYPRIMRRLLHLGLRSLPVDEIEAALRSGSGPAPLRIAGAIADHIEAELAARASAYWLVAVVAANLLAYLVILFVV